MSKESKVEYLTIVGTPDNDWDLNIEIGQTICLIKEPNNRVDLEAIKINDLSGSHIGYVSNSVRNVILGTSSAGRLYDRVGACAKAKVTFVLPKGSAGNYAIAKLINCDTCQ